MPTILGGGISGLSAAYYLTKNNIKPITILEATNRLGGWIKTEKYDNFMFECGPRTIRPVGINGKNTLELVDELNLGNDQSIYKIQSNHVAAKNRMIYVNNNLCSLPNTMMGFFKTIPPFSKPLYRALINDYRTGPSPEPLKDESIYSFIERRFGTELAKYAISSMICGICAGDAKEISVKFLFDPLFDVEQKYGGVLKGLWKGRKEAKSSRSDADNNSLVKQSKTEKWRIYSFNDGLEILPKTVANYLQQMNVNINLNSECENITFNDNGSISVFCNGEEQLTDHLISSLPSYKIGKLLEKQHPVLATDLKSIPYVDVVVVNIQYDAEKLIPKPGFGFLVPPCENLPILGVIYDSCCFEMPGNTVLTVMMGGKWFPKYFGDNPTETELYDIALKYIKSIMKIDNEPAFYKVNILRNCIPQYIVGHHDRIERIRSYITDKELPISLCGAPYDGVGVNDVIYSAKQVVDNYLMDNSN